VSKDVLLTTVVDVLAAESPLAITVDGKAVREVPGPQGLPYIGNYFEVYPDHLGNHQRLFEKYGPFIKTTNMGSVVYHTNDPTLSSIVFAESDFFSKNIVPGHPLFPIKNKEAGVFLGDTNTEEWKTAHKFLPPAFGPKAVRHYAPTMQATVEDAFRVFDELDEKEESWNVYPYMLKLGSQAVGKLVLGMDFKHFTAPDAPLHEMVMRIAQSLALNKKVTSMGSWYAKMPFGAPQQLRNARGRIIEMVNESIENASKGVENLELQEAALKAENMVGE
jgi:cytochrome P450